MSERSTTGTSTGTSTTGNRVLVIGAHPDDEVLGCGGTVAKHTSVGDEVCSVIMCEGESHRNTEQTTEGIHHSDLAARVLGVGRVERLGFPDQRLETLPLTELITPLERIIADFLPNIVYCQFGGDVNLDHKVLFEAVQVAVRPTHTMIEEVYAFDTASSTEWAYPRTFVPDLWVCIDDTLQQKLDAMACFKTELREYPHPRSLKALEYRAKSWGNQACMDSAEVFMTVRRICRHAKTPG